LSLDLKEEEEGLFTITEGRELYVSFLLVATKMSSLSKFETFVAFFATDVTDDNQLNRRTTTLR